MKNYTNTQVAEEFQAFLDDKKSLMLSTVSNESEPFASYSPFVQDKNENYYVCVSSAVQHSINLTQSKKAHILIIEDEAKADNIYARKRLYFDANVEKFEENDLRAESIFELFDNKFGESLSFLRKMSDFRIYKLTANIKSLILGFGAAYQMDKNGLILQKKIAHKNKH